MLKLILYDLVIQMHTAYKCRKIKRFLLYFSCTSLLPIHCIGIPLFALEYVKCHVQCNFQIIPTFRGLFHPLSSSRTLYNWYPFRRSLKASPAIDELATPFLKRSEACKKSLKKGKVKNKERGRSSKLAWIRGEADGLHGEGERQTGYVGKGQCREHV